MSNALRLRDAMELLSEGDLVLLFKSPASVDRLRAAVAEIAGPDLVVEMAASDDGFKGTFEGVEGFIDGWRDFLETFTRLESGIEDVIETGDRVVVLTTLRGTTATGGVELDNQAAGVFTFDGGRLSRAEFYLDRAGALRAAGLESE